jgi:N-acetylmuramoyl-L-alanine amidase
MKKLLRILLPLLIFLTLAGTSIPAEAVTVRTAQVTVNLLIVRSGPGTTHNRIATVTAGVVLPVLDQQSGWTQIRLTNGTTGWVSSEFVNVATPTPTQTVRVTTSTLIVRSGAGTTFTRIATVSSGTVLPVLQTRGEWHQVWLRSGQIGWVHSTYTVVDTVSSPSAPNTPGAPTPKEGIVNHYSLRVRSGPDVTFDQITALPNGTRLTILQAQGKWLQVRLPSGQNGWVFAEFIGEAPPLPKPEPIANPQPIPAQPGTGSLATVTVSSLRVRTGPSTSHERITAIPQGVTVRVIGQSADWLQIALPDGRTGWIAGWFATLTSNGTTSPVAGKTIVLDAGHGGRDPGAIGVTGLYESEVNLDVTLRVAEMLRRAGARVVLTREDNTFVSNPDRAIVANAVYADIFVSIHANAHTNSAAGGTETYFYQFKVRGAESRHLATALQNELALTLGLRNIGVKHGNFHVIRETTMPSALVELAFLSNAAEEALMRTDAFRQNSAEALFRGLENYFR